MHEYANRWTLILAAGSGTRLSSLTADGSGGAVPKQFCSLNGGASLLEETFDRAHAFSTERRTLVVVAAEHRKHWYQVLSRVPRENVLVQPKNRGTANGILFGLTAIMARDPNALVTILPSDHYVAKEDVLRRSVSRALAVAEYNPADAVHFLGITPETADPELGYIVRGEPQVDGSYQIGRFVEKPSAALAADLLRKHALWNSFILVAYASVLVGLVGRRFPAEVAAFAAVWREHRAGGLIAEAALDRLYATLREIDFSRGVVEGTAAPLRVMPVPYCGWSDLGTPKRVADALRRADRSRVTAPSRHLNLAEACARWLGQVALTQQSA
jgi:mannose-1-phosphate guanylyltransferase